EVEPLAAREDCDRNLLNLGRGEDEFDVRRRFFERLQERVERLAREHVDFVDDVDLVPAAGRAGGDLLADGPHVVDAAVAGPVDLAHVDVVAGGNGQATAALGGGLGPVP